MILRDALSPTERQRLPAEPAYQAANITAWSLLQEGMVTLSRINMPIDPLIWT
jgi:hypothetical protein